MSPTPPPPIPPGRQRPRYGKKGIKKFSAGGRGEAIPYFHQPLIDRPIKWSTKAPPEERKPHFMKHIVHEGMPRSLLVYRCNTCGVRFWRDPKPPKLEAACRMCCLKKFKHKSPSYVLPLTTAELEDMRRFYEEKGVAVSHTHPTS